MPQVKKTNGPDKPTERSMTPKEVENIREQAAGPKGKPNEAARAKMIKEGYFTEKDGDLYPTKKYYEAKKKGGLKTN